jgi:hypothetical protein
VYVPLRWLVRAGFVAATIGTCAQARRHIAHLCGLNGKALRFGVQSFFSGCMFGIENIRTQADPSVGKLYVVRTRLYADETERVRCLVKPSWDTCQLTLACNLNMNSHRNANVRTSNRVPTQI